MPDPHMASKITNSRWLPAAQNRRTYAMQATIQEGHLPHVPEPDPPICTGNPTESRAQSPTNRRNPTLKHVERPTEHQVDPPTSPAPHRAKPGNYYTRARVQPPGKDALPYTGTTYKLLESGWTPSVASVTQRQPYRNQIRTTSNDTTRQRYLRPTEDTDEGCGSRAGNRNEERRSTDMKNEHRKRRTAATEETTKW